jgi:hypothetical protein
MILRMEARMSSIDCSCSFAGCVIPNPGIPDEISSESRD